MVEQVGKYYLLVLFPLDLGGGTPLCLHRQRRFDVLHNGFEHPQVEVHAQLVRHGQQHGICRLNGSITSEFFGNQVGFANVAAPKP